MCFSPAPPHSNTPASMCSAPGIVLRVDPVWARAAPTPLKTTKNKNKQTKKTANKCQKTKALLTLHDFQGCQNAEVCAQDNFFLLYSVILKLLCLLLYITDQHITRSDRRYPGKSVWLEKRKFLSLKFICHAVHLVSFNRDGLFLRRIPKRC